MGTLPDTIETPRLLLRTPAAADIPALVRGLGRFTVSRWLGRVPHPYVPRHARQFLAFHAKARAQGRDLGYVIALRTRPSHVIGGIGAHWIDEPSPVVGYWIAEPHWRQGYAGEALAALLRQLLTLRPGARPRATVIAGNARSERVLRRAGFVRQPGLVWQACRSRNRKVQVARYQLGGPPPAGDPLAPVPIVLQTARLVLEQIEIGADPRRVREPDGRIRLLPPPFTPSSFNFACMLEGAQVGVIGLQFRDDGVEIGYRILPEHRRKGLASEALRELVRHAFEDYRIEALEAVVAEDNVPSMALLAKLGFRSTGADRERWSMRRQAYISYRTHTLSRAQTD